MQPTNVSTTYKVKRPIIILGLAVVLLIIFWLIWMRSPNYKQVNLYETGLNVDSNAWVINDSIYTHNGVAFYKLGIKSQELNMLSSGLRLPKAEKIFWSGDKGALLNFESSFYGTEVEKALRSKDLSLSQATQNYTWYLDFNTSSLTVVSENPVRDDLAFFAESKNGYYFIEDPSPSIGIGESDIDINSTPVRFFDIESKKTKLITSTLSLVDIGYWGPCPDQNKIACVSGRDIKDARNEDLYEVKENDEPELLLSSGGRLFPTNDPRYYFSVVSPDTLPDEDTDLSNQKVIFNNIETGRTTDAGFEIGNEDIFVHINETGEFYLFDNSSLGSNEQATSQSYRTGVITDKDKVSSASLTIKREEGFTPKIISLGNSYDRQASLATDVSGNKWIISSDTGLNDFPVVNSQQAELAINNCLVDASQFLQFFPEQKLFKVFFQDNNVLGARLGSFVKCLSEQQNHGLHGFQYYVGLTDPVSGRITSD